MRIPTADAEIGFELPEDAEPTGPLTWRAADFTIELAEECPTDPLSRPFDIDDWKDGFADETWTFVEPEAPRDVGCAGRNENGTEIRVILFSQDDGDYRAARITSTAPISRSLAARIGLRIASRDDGMTLADLLS